ncbi:MAG: hypothetical protein HY763_04760 [Planctomycetes bacterium]|nr:hypothetical protein [Planctomycetota bacterium]
MPSELKALLQEWEARLQSPWGFAWLIAMLELALTMAVCAINATAAMLGGTDAITPDQLAVILTMLAAFATLVYVYGVKTAAKGPVAESVTLVAVWCAAAAWVLVAGRQIVADTQSVCYLVLLGGAGLCVLLGVGSAAWNVWKRRRAVPGAGSEVAPRGGRTPVGPPGG